jgi:uncharacterized lipoprotein YddW (UPF0748 family)
MRAAWVATVHNLNFPSSAGLSAETQRAEIRRIVSTAAASGLNTLMVQVRPEGDALYRSRIEPWSRFVSGTQGVDPGYDPLATFIAEGRAQGIAIHAWINPYRAATSSKASRARNHITNTMPGAVRRVGSMLWMDPGDPAVRQHVVRVVQDIVSRYDVAGVVIDDYFYPYPGSGIPRGTFPDDETFAKYGKGQSRADWRRNNVHSLVRDLNGVVSGGGRRFGVSPFGIWRPNVPPGVEAQLDQVMEIYSDPLVWMREGWIDYLSPQLYWADAGPQSYSALLQWWRSPQANPRGVPIIPSIAADRMGGSHKWPASEIAKQLELEKKIGPRRGNTAGYILWSMGPVMRDLKGVREVIRNAR